MKGFQSGDQKNGFVYTQPVYFDLGEDKDATVTFDLFQKRGSRLGLQARYEMKEYSGFEINMDHKGCSSDSIPPVLSVTKSCPASWKFMKAMAMGSMLATLKRD